MAQPELFQFYPIAKHKVSMGKSVVLSRCEQTENQKHMGSIFGYCEKCHCDVCSVCSTETHYDHFECFTSYDLQCTNMANSLILLKSKTGKAIKTHREILPSLNLEKVSNEIEEKIRYKYRDFISAMKGHFGFYMERVRKGKFVEKLRKQLFTLVAQRISKMQNLKSQLKNNLETLLEASQKQNYFPQLGKLKQIDGFLAEVKVLTEAQARETGDLLQKINRFKDVVLTRNTSILPKICYIENLEKIEAKVYKICREEFSILSYCISSKKLLHICHSKFTPPYNSSLTELEGVLYILGGCKKDGMPEEDSNYLRSNLEIDPYLIENISEKSPMINQRMCFGCTSCESFSLLFVVGGYKSADVLDDCEVYFRKTDSWKSLPKLCEKKSNCAVCLLDEKNLYSFGGYSTKKGDVPTIEKLEFNILEIEKTKNWVIVINEEVEAWIGCQNPGAVAINSSEILVFGGKHKSENNKTAFILKISNGTLDQIKDMEEGDSMLSCRPILFNKKVYSFGCHETNLHIFDIKQLKWTLFPDLVIPNLEETPKRSKRS